MKLLIIEDDAEIIEVITVIIKMRWPDCSVVSAQNGERGIELVDTTNPDLIILDLGLPDIDGFNVLNQIRSFSITPVIILTVRGEKDNIIKGLELGADDYMTKPFEHTELLARAQAVLRRTNKETEQIPITCGDLRFGPALSKLNYKGKDIFLTNTEGLVLYNLMKNAGTVMSYTELAEHVWGDDYPGVVNNIRVYIKRLRIKLETDPGNPKIILTKVGVGYFLHKPDVRTSC